MPQPQKSISTEFLQLVSSLVSVNIDEENDLKKLYSLCLTVKQIYFVRNLRFVGPDSFSKELLKWSFSGSKASHALAGSTAVDERRIK